VSLLAVITAIKGTKISLFVPIVGFMVIPLISAIKSMVTHQDSSLRDTMPMTVIRDSLVIIPPENHMLTNLLGNLTLIK